MSKTDSTLTMEEWMADDLRRTGNIHRDTYSKGRKKGRQVKYDCYKAEITVHGIRYRRREKTRDACAEWLKAVISKKILPSDNKADWLRSEQHKDMAARYDEMAATNCEEGLIVYDYYQTGDITPLAEYIEKSLLPHLVYYSCHTIGLGRKTSIIYSREAVALILTRIAAHRLVMNMTALAKRIIRTKRYGNTFYYDHMPKDMRLIVDGVDYTPLEQLWKVTRDKRL